MKNRFAVLVCLLAALCGCGEPKDTPPPPPPPPPPLMNLIVSSHVAFFEADGKTLRPAPKEPMRLWMPYVVGDLYGAPNAGELVPVSLASDMSFSVDLNRSLPLITNALVPTAFSQKWMFVEPASARIARLSPWVLPADGIAPLGMCEWLDEDTGDKLMLIYLDRPAHVRGDIVYEGRSLRFDVQAKAAGYLWISNPDGAGIFRAIPRPARVVLGVMPN